MATAVYICMAMAMHSCMATTIHICMAIAIHICMAIAVHNCMAMAMHMCLVIFIHICMATTMICIPIERSMSGGLAPRARLVRNGLKVRCPTMREYSHNVGVLPQCRNSPTM